MEIFLWFILGLILGACTTLLILDFWYKKIKFEERLKDVDERLKSVDSTVTEVYKQQIDTLFNISEKDQKESK